MKIGARNKLSGEVVEIKKGAVMCEVKVKLNVVAGAQMESVMTMTSLEEMGLKPGDKVQVIAKAVNVLLMKE